MLMQTVCIYVYTYMHIATYIHTCMHIHVYSNVYADSMYMCIVKDMRTEIVCVCKQ